jgi:hypothetical protein
VLDYCYEHNAYQNDKIYVNMKDTKVKDLFKEQIFKEVRNSVTFGTKIIVVGTCKPLNNWRKEQRGHALNAFKYGVFDESVSIDLRIMESFLDYCWVVLLKKSNYILVEHNEVDSLDLKNYIEDKVGKQFITVVPSKFLMIRDSNYDYVRSHGDKYPEYLQLQINNKLVEKGVMTHGS